MNDESGIGAACGFLWSLCDLEFVMSEFSTYAAVIGTVLPQSALLTLMAQIVFSAVAIVRVGIGTCLSTKGGDAAKDQRSDRKRRCRKDTGY
mmetsp:Transcript_24326/g.58988  ORF Transcript_24326/g.58988 Transcript_24326/m.58988 type:complete len:92 (-) Transcript_24326:790-1065(-)